MKKSPLAPTDFPALAPLDGVRLGAIETGVKYRGRDDLMLAALSPQTVVAGVLTRSATAAAPVLWCRRRLDSADEARALIVNAGNANAFTGDVGARHVRATCEAVAAEINCRAEQVLAASTGVIGEPLPVERIVRAV
ncbi:MAG: bifunctional ornithine acetyltransferase/N-acetylglutamate synthase, partial [bacterium]